MATTIKNSNENLIAEEVDNLINEVNETKSGKNSRSQKEKIEEFKRYKKDLEPAYKSIPRKYHISREEMNDGEIEALMDWGLWKAVEKREDAQGNRFYGYATTKMEYEVQEYIAQMRDPISYNHDLISKKKKIRSFYEANPFATLEQAASGTGLTKEQVHDLRDYSFTSMDGSMDKNDPESDSLGEHIADEGVLDPRVKMTLSYIRSNYGRMGEAYIESLGFYGKKSNAELARKYGLDYSVFNRKLSQIETEVARAFAGC